MWLLTQPFQVISQEMLQILLALTNSELMMKSVFCTFSISSIFFLLQDQDKTFTSTEELQKKNK